MKLKFKFTALTLATVMGVGMLVGCNKNKPAPAPAPKYLVNVPTSADFRIDGIVEDRQYVEGAAVSFTVAVLNEDKELTAAGYQVGAQRTALEPVAGVYTFSMPAQNVSLYASLRDVERYTLTAGGELKVDSAPVTFSLELGTDPVARWELTAIEGGTLVSINNHEVTPLAAGDVTFAAIVEEQQVATLECTIAPSELMSIKAALDAAIVEAPCNGSGGNNSAKTTTDFTIAGKVVYVTDYDDSGAKDVIIDDGTEAVLLVVYSSSKATHEWALGDSVKTTCKFTNYYGLLEGISTTSTATKQNSLYPDQIIKIEKTFATQYLTHETMTGAQFLTYAQTATDNQSATAGAYTDLKYVSIDVTYDAEHNMKSDGSVKGGYVIDGTENLWAINAAEKTVSTVDLDAVTGHKSTLKGLLTGVNSSYKTTKMYAFDQYPLSVESVTITEGDALTVFLNNPVTLHYTTYPAGSYGEAIWTSSDQNNVSVDENGAVTGLQVSTETITLTVGGASATITVTVSGEQHVCEAVALDEHAITVIKGEKATLTATITPDNCTDAVVWTTSDPTVATVVDGEVTAVKAGTATITVTCGDFNDSCTITVREQTIADLAHARVDDPVDVYGYVTGKYPVSGKYGLWIADGTYGLCLNKAPASGMDVGVIVHVVGKISAYNGAKQVAVTSWEVVESHEGLSAPVTATVNQAFITGISEVNQGVKGTVTGVVSSNSVSSSGHRTVKVTVGSETFTIYIHATNCGATVINDFARAAVGRTITASGFISGNKSSATDFTTLTKTQYQFINPTLDNVVIPELTGLALDKNTANVKQGATLQLEATPVPAISEFPSAVVWSVTGNDKVTVSQNGLVSVATDAVVDSTATVTATCGSFHDDCVITVKDSSSTEPTEVYKLDGAITGGDNGYATESDITQANIAWKVTGNTTLNPWRIGGKNLDDEDRLVYSTAAVTSYDCDKVVVTLGSITLSALNSITLKVGSTQKGNDVSVVTITSGLEANAVLEFTKPEGANWANRYYTLVFNVDAGGSNQYVQLVSVSFIATI